MSEIQARNPDGTFRKGSTRPPRRPSTEGKDLAQSVKALVIADTDPDAEAMSQLVDGLAQLATGSNKAQASKALTELMTLIGRRSQKQAVDGKPCPTCGAIVGEPAQFHISVSPEMVDHYQGQKALDRLYQRAVEQEDQTGVADHNRLPLPKEPTNGKG